MRRRVHHPFETQRGAETWARKFDHARQFNRLPILEVEQDDAEWWVVNPDVDARPHKPRTPVV